MALIIGFAMTACDDGGSDDNSTKPSGTTPAGFVAVTDITGVPATATVGTPLTLTGTVEPATATNKTIVWTVTNGTGTATVSGNTLNPTGAGSVTVKATIVNGTAQGTNYTKDFTITVSGGSTGVNQTPTADDFNIGNLSQNVGSVTAVTITPKGGKTTGAVSNIKYNGNATLPTAEGSYPVTFDVAAATGWNAATNLSAGTLWISPQGTFVASTVSDITTWLSNQTANTAATPFTVVMNVATVPYISADTFSDKYVSLDFSGSTFTSINQGVLNAKTNITSVILPDSITDIGTFTFYQCTSLTSVIIPASVTSIGSQAFSNCSSLTSVTFEGTITADGLLTSTSSGGTVTSFTGDLRDKYLAGGPGTYTTTYNFDSTVWTKQP